MRDVAVVGANMLKFGRYPDKDVVRLASEATLGALKDAGITINEVEIVSSGNLYQSNAMVGQRVMKEIGATGVPVINVANACATGSTASARPTTQSPPALTMSHSPSAPSKWARWASWVARGRRKRRGKCSSPKAASVV